MDPPACRIVGWILHDLCSKWYGSHSGNWNLLASDSISLRHRIWVFHSASLQVLIGRNLALEHPRLSPDDSRLHLFVDLRFSNCAPYFSATLSATSLDWFWIQSSAPLRLVDPPRWRLSSVLAWTDSETSRERVPRRSALRFLSALFDLSSSRSAYVRALIVISISLHPSNLHLNPSYIS